MGGTGSTPGRAGRLGARGARGCGARGGAAADRRRPRRACRSARGDADAADRPGRRPGGDRVGHRLPGSRCRSACCSARPGRPTSSSATTARSTGPTSMPGARSPPPSPCGDHRRAGRPGRLQRGGACEVGAGVMPDCVAVRPRRRVQVADSSPSTLPPFPEPAARRRTRPSATSGERSTCRRARRRTSDRHRRALRRGRRRGRHRARTVTCCCSRSPIDGVRRASSRPASSPSAANYDRTPGRATRRTARVVDRHRGRRGGLRHPRAEQQR